MYKRFLEYFYTNALKTVYNTYSSNVGNIENILHLDYPQNKTLTCMIYDIKTFNLFTHAVAYIILYQSD